MNSKNKYISALLLLLGLMLLPSYSALAENLVYEPDNIVQDLPSTKNNKNTGFKARTAGIIINNTDILPHEDSTSDEKQPIDFTANEITYDKKLGIVTARGEVEVFQKGVSLRADTVSYNMKEDFVTASGDVFIVQPDGTATFANYTKLSGDLKDGVAKNILVVMADKSRIAAKEVTRKSGVKSQMRNAVYSPCDVCKDKSDPLWQIKAKKIVNDAQKKTVYYQHAWLELWGMPVFYSPYLSHPDQTVKRRSGFLIPTIGSSPALDSYVKAPYYYAIDEHKDFTFTPIISFNQNPVLGGEYRGYYPDGKLNLIGSATENDENSTRGHIDMHLVDNMNSTWRTKLDVKRSSDKNYLRRYDMDQDSESWLRTALNVEGFYKRSYMDMGAYSYQGVRSDNDNDRTPVVAPAVYYNYVGSPSKHGAYNETTINTAVITRKEGAKTNKLNMETLWNLPYIAPAGDMYKLSAKTRGDLYYVNDKVIEETNSEYDGTITRLHPELSLEWRYPLVRTEKASHQVVEPIVVGVASPRGGDKSEKVPNEDSRDLQLDDTNILDSSHFIGYDRIETGSRVNYGVKWSIYGDEEGQATALLGQGYRFNDNDDIFPDGSGLEDDFTDYVGNLYASPGKFLNMNYRFRFDKDTLEPNYQEAYTSFGNDLLRMGVSYLFIRGTDDDFTEYEDRHEITNSLRSRINKAWYADLYTKRDLAKDGGVLENGLGVTYEDECMVFNIKAKREYGTEYYDYDEDEAEDGTSIIFTVEFKTLGGVSSGG